jgi:hypothetical protein
MKKIAGVSLSCGSTFDETAFFNTPEREALMHSAKVPFPLFHKYYDIFFTYFFF